jgi:hypothetical protein
MTYFAFVVLVVLAGAIAFVYLDAKSKKLKRQKLVEDANRFMRDMTRRSALETAATTATLGNDEQAFYSQPSVLSETRAVRRYQAGSAGFRVAKGVFVGGTKGTSYSTQELSKIDSGVLTVTNKRILFVGNNASSRTIKLEKIIAAEPGLSEIEVSIEGRQKTMIFSAPNPLILSAIVLICTKAPDPRDLSGDTINIRFE